MTPLHVGVIAPAWVPVPPPVYGGTEAFVDQLCRGLLAAGHSVTLFATGDSTCPVPTRWHFPESKGISGDIVTELQHVQAAHDALSDVDVIHDNTLLGPWWSLTHPDSPPIVTTAHGEFTPELTRLYSAIGRDVGVIALSHAQRLTAPDVPIVEVIHHGVDVDRFPTGAGDGGYLLFLGRMSPDKGAHRAIRAARAAGKHLLLAAKMREPGERRYYAEQVEPLLGPDAVFMGEVGGDRKLSLLAGAEALLNPIRWPEPFGLVMIEALACGTPVVTFAEGSAPEIVRHGTTGFLCTDDADMVEHLRMLPSLDRTACRNDARDRFSTSRMVADHLRLYERVLSDGVAPLVDRARVTDDLTVIRSEIRLPEEERTDRP